MKTFIGSYYIERHSTSYGEKHIVYQVVDYVGQDHILVKEVGWSYAKAKLRYRGQYEIINWANECTQKTSIVEIKKIIENIQKSRLSFYFCKEEVEKKLTDLLNDPYDCLKVEDIDEWIMSLTKENISN